LDERWRTGAVGCARRVGQLNADEGEWGEVDGPHHGLKSQKEVRHLGEDEDWNNGEEALEKHLVPAKQQIGLRATNNLGKEKKTGAGGKRWPKFLCVGVGLRKGGRWKRGLRVL